MKVGFTCSTFDLLHAGHILMLKEAKQKCDYLLVALQTNPNADRPEKSKPIQSIYERYTQLKAVKYIDEIVLYDNEEDLLNVLKTTNINIRIIGSDYIDKDFTGKQYCIQNNIEIFYHNRGHNYSTTGLRRKLKEENDGN